MSLHLQAVASLSVFSGTYDETGASAAATPFSVSALLAASTTNVNVFTVDPLTAGYSSTLVFTGTSAPVNAAFSITTARPVGGSGVATLDGLRAFQILLTADSITPAEAASGSTATRTTSGTWTITDVNDVTTYAKGTFNVTTPGQVCSDSCLMPTALPADLKLTLSFTTAALATQIRILTAAE